MTVIISSPTADIKNVRDGNSITLTGHRLFKGQKVFATITDNNTKIFCTLPFPVNEEVEHNFLQAPILSTGVAAEDAVLWKDECQTCPK